MAGLEEQEEISGAAVHLRVPPPAAGRHSGRLQPARHGYTGVASANSDIICVLKVVINEMNGG